MKSCHANGVWTVDLFFRYWFGRGWAERLPLHSWLYWPRCVCSWRRCSYQEHWNWFDPFRVNSSSCELDFVSFGNVSTFSSYKIPPIFFNSFYLCCYCRSKVNFQSNWVQHGRQCDLVLSDRTLPPGGRRQDGVHRLVLWLGTHVQLLSMWKLYNVGSTRCNDIHSSVILKGRELIS